MKAQKIWGYVAALMLVVSTMSVSAQESVDSPHQVVEKVTADLLAEVKKSAALLKSDPDKYFESIQKIIEPAVKFEYIAKNVMGVYWQKATPAQQEEFVKVFTQGMVKTYAKGMANYADLKIEVLPPEGDVAEFGKHTVLQKVTAADGINRVAYTMGRSKDDGLGWMLINVVLDGVNLGKTFRSQFAQLVKEYEGDLDAAINAWQSND